MLRLVESVIIVIYLGLSKTNKRALSRLDLVQITGVINGPLKFLTARKILPLLDLLAKFKRVLACSCSQNFCSCSHARFLVSIERKSKTDLHGLPMWSLWLRHIIRCLRVIFLFLRARLSEIYLFCRI